MSSSAPPEALPAARSALDRHEWDAAYEAFLRADAEEPLEAPDVVRLAEAATWSGRHADVVAFLERAAAGFVAADDRPAAARAILNLAREHWERGDTAVAAGSIGRAAHLLEGMPECAEHGLLAFMIARGASRAGDLDGALAQAQIAIDVGRRTGDRDVEALGRLEEAHVLLVSQRVEEGRASLDAINAAAMGGDLGLVAAGTIFCSTLWACRNAGDWARAGEWTQVSLRWCERQRVNGFPGLCRFHRAEVMRFHGDYDDAETDARNAIAELLDAKPRYAAWGFMELGEIQRRRGDLDAAAASFRRSLELGTDPQPSLALLELDVGHVAGAQACIRRALADGDLMAREERTLVLPAAVTIALAAGAPDEAATAATELRDLAGAWATPATNAAAWRAEGELALAAGELPDAIDRLERAWRIWCDVEAPYEAAQTRVLLGRAYLAAGDRATAELELATARSTFERLGARVDADRLQRLLQRDRRDTRATKSFMFTDIVDSTRLVEVVGDDAWQSLLAWHDRTLRACFAKHDGAEVKHEGDGFFVAFDRPDDALAAAIKIQQTLAAHRREHGFAPPVRIGVHAATATEVDGDYFGRGVHEAARVAGVARGDEIVASAAVFTLPDVSCSFSDRRAVELKGLSAPIEIATVDWS